MAASLTRKDAESLYDEDFFRWTEVTAAALREGRLAEIDLEHAAEEIESLGKLDRREIRSRAIVLIHHLIKWSVQRERRSTSTWRATIHDQRFEIDLIVRDSPSLSDLVAHELSSLYNDAAEDARDEIGPDIALPSECPFTAAQILDRHWLPA